MLPLNIEDQLGNGRLIYLAAPYSAYNPDGSEDKILIADRMRIFSLCVEQFMLKGFHVVSPLLMHMVRTHTNDLPGNWDYWKTYSEILLQKCEVMAVIQIDGWKTSTGVLAEFAIANRDHKVVYSFDPAAVLQGRFEHTWYKLPDEPLQQPAT